MPRLPPRSRDDAPPARDGRRIQALRRRCAHLAAEGYAAREIAEVEGVEAGHVEDLLGDEAFGRLVRAYKVLSSKPDEERRAKLVRLARNVIDEAMALGHVRVAFFVIREELRGRDAAETVADKLIAQRARAAEPLPPTPEPAAPDAPRRRAHLPAHPADRMAQRGCRDLMKALLGEVRVRGEGLLRAAREAATSTLRPATAAPPPSRPQRLLTRLLPTTAAITPAGACPPKLAQAP